MKITKDLYNCSFALLTDLYQLTMSYGYWKSGMAEQEAVFNLFFRKNPFQGGFTIACGLEYITDYLNNFCFSKDDLDYISTIKGNDEKPLFDKGFIDYLSGLKFSCNVDAVPEGSVVFPHEPLVRISGPIIQCQILETPLLNIINFQSLIATKAARVVKAAHGEPVLEFGLRRAQGIDGGLAASRASYIGGASATSNVLAGKLFDIPVKGTHAHSWVMAFDTEQEAFDTYADALPNNCVFLVDTYDTLDGVKHAIETGKKLREHGHRMVGIRLDSGDLAYLSIEARKLLDEAGFQEVSIVASNDLDENIISSLKDQGAKINVWGVGTKLVTAYDQPALGGVYKLAAIKDESGRWNYKVKLSEQTIKVSNPGILQVKRFYNESEYLGDMIYNIENFNPDSDHIIVDPMDITKRKKMGQKLRQKDLLVPIFKKGKLVYTHPSIHDVRKLVQEELKMFHEGIKRFLNPHAYPVGLELGLFNYKTDLILKLRENNLKVES